uniref:Uncharacterized protein n=1 Tax=Arundo donax TaxID=35708 RepID=A0A0A9FJQ2_ARUDO
MLHEGEEVQQGMCRGRRHRARVASQKGAGVHGRPQGRRRQRRLVQGARRPDRHRIARRCDHLAHPGHQQRSVQRETGADGGAEGRVRRLQGGHRTSRLPEP